MIADSISLAIAERADAAAIAALSRDDIEFGLGWSWTPARVERSVRHRDVNVVVAKDGAVLAGFGIMKYGDEGASLNLLAVTRRYRRHGTGTRIVEWLERVAISAGIFEIAVQLRETNAGAKAFYEKLGFEMIDRAPGYYDAQEAAVIMAKQLGVSASPI